MAKGRRSKKRIADEIMISVGRSVLIVFFVVAAMAIVIVHSVITSSKEKELTLESGSASYQLADFFDQYLRVVEQMAVNPQIVELMEHAGAGADVTETKGYDTVFENMQNIAGMDAENIMASWIGDIDANMLCQSDSYVSGDDFDITQRAWYAAAEKKTAVLTEPYVDISTGKLILSAAAPVFGEGGEVLGVTGLDLSLEQVNMVLDQYKIGRQGYIILLSADGAIIYHPNEELVQKNIHDVAISENIWDALDSKEETFLEYKLDGVTKYGYVAGVGDTGYCVISSLPFKEFYSLLFKMIAAFVIVFAGGILLVMLSLRRLSSKLTKPILNLNAAAQELAAGNLEVNLEITAEDEIGELGISIQKTVDQLKNYIVYIDEISASLVRMAEGRLRIELKNDYAGEFRKVKTALLNISKSMNDVMLGIHDSANQVAAGADELARSSQALAEGAGTQAAAVEELVATASTVSEQVLENQKEAEMSADETDKVTDMMEKSREQMRQMQEAMDKINETSQQVVGIIQAIEEIAAQTNLLSLNASIEAARAGEAGKGFAVVADEIGKLAEESSKAANTTRNLIGVSMDEIGKGNEFAGAVVNSLKEVMEAVEHVNTMVKSTAEKSAFQAHSMEQIRAGVEEISQGIQDSSAAAEESSATSEELAAQAATLNEMVQRFELDEA